RSSPDDPRAPNAGRGRCPPDRCRRRRKLKTIGWPCSTFTKRSAARKRSMGEERLPLGFKWRLHQLRERRRPEACIAPLLRHWRIQSSPLLRDAPQRSDQRLHLLWSEFLSVLGTCRAGDAFVHQGSAEIIDSSVQQFPDANGAQFYPGCLNIGDDRMQHQARDSMQQLHLAPSRPLACLPAGIDRRFHVHKRQWNELGETGGALLETSYFREMASPVQRTLHVTEHDGCGRSQSHLMGCANYLQPFSRTEFVRANNSTHFVVKDPRRRSRQRTQSCVLQPLKKRLDRYAQGVCAVRYFQRRKRVDMHPRDFRFHRPQQGEICIAGIVRIDAALHTHLGGATVPGLARPTRHFCVREVIRISPQLLAHFSLREGAEAAFERAYVRVVDIAIDDVTN